MTIFDLICAVMLAVGNDMQAFCNIVNHLVVIFARK
jgi:hypothetical protein